MKEKWCPRVARTKIYCLLILQQKWQMNKMFAAAGWKQVLRKSDLVSRFVNRLNHLGQIWKLQQQQKFWLIVGDILQTTGIHSLNMAWLAIQICGKEFTGLQRAARYSTAGPQQNVQRQHKIGSIILQRKIFRY